MHKPPSRRLPPLRQLIELMAVLRSPGGCPWDREQDHTTLRYHAVEEVYELIDAIEAGDDREMLKELGDVLLQVVFHCQLAREQEGLRSRSGGPCSWTNWSAVTRMSSGTPGWGTWTRFGRTGTGSSGRRRKPGPGMPDPPPWTESRSICRR